MGAGKKQSKAKKIAILHGGGLCPGSNNVIKHAVFTSLIEYGTPIWGIYDGFSKLRQGDAAKVQLTQFTLDGVRLIGDEGGSVIYTARDSLRKGDYAEKAARVLLELGFDGLVAIGGDDTLGSAAALSRAAKKLGGNISCVHVTKSIDDDFDYRDSDGQPMWYAHNFGVASSIDKAAAEIRILRSDEHCTGGRGYLINMMGRHAGILPLRTAEAAGIRYIFIAELFKPGSLEIEKLAEMQALAFKKLVQDGFRGGLVLQGENIWDAFTDRSKRIVKEHPTFDDHGNIELGNTELAGEVVKFLAPLAKEWVKVRAFDALGYLCRAVPPNAADSVLTEHLGRNAVEIIAGGGSDVSVCWIPDRGYWQIPFSASVDQSGKAKTRKVDIRAAHFAGALQPTIALMREAGVEPAA